MFCVSFVVVTVKARLASLDPRLEQAAMDLYADEWQTFRRVTLPLAAPGILAAALLAFALSFDDFIITNFNSGNVTTFPKFVYVSAARGIPPQANVIGTAMFVVALLVVLVGQPSEPAAGPDRSGPPGPGQEQRALAGVARSARPPARTRPAPRRCGPASPAGRPGPPAGAGSRASARSPTSASTIASPAAGPLARPTATARFSSTTGDGDTVDQHPVERGDPGPVGLVRGHRPGMAGRDRRLQRVRAEVAAERLHPLQRGQPAPDQQPVPAPPVLVGQQHRRAVRAGPGRQPGGLDLHQRDQPVHLGLGPAAGPASTRPSRSASAHSSGRIQSSPAVAA